jgi:hypothetical protein
VSSRACRVPLVSFAYQAPIDRVGQAPLQASQRIFVTLPAVPPWTGAPGQSDAPEWPALTQSVTAQHPRKSSTQPEWPSASETVAARQTEPTAETFTVAEADIHSPGGPVDGVEDLNRRSADRGRNGPRTPF